MTEPLTIAGAEVWDWTKLSAYINCKLQGHLAFEEHLVPKEPSEALAFGIGMHRMAEVWMRARMDGLPDQPAMELARGAFVEVWERELGQATREKLEMEANRRSIANAVRLFEAYPRKFPFEMYDEVIALETPFTLFLGTTPGGRRVCWSGILDRAVKWQGGVYYVDLKTTSFAADDRFFNGFRYNGQMVGYAWAGKELLGQEFTGIMVQAVEVKAAPKTSRGRGAEDMWAQDIIPIHREHIEEWKRMVLGEVDRIHVCREAGEFPPAMGHACNVFGNGCQFREYCWAPPELREGKREILFRKRVWNPLDRDGNGTKEG